MVEFRTRVGRIVWGNPGKPQVKKNQQTKQPVLKDGQPVNQWAFGVAFPKAEFQQDTWPHLAAEAATGYPNGTPQKFSWKYVDGDGIDGNGQPYNTREGYAGCCILTVSTEAFAPPVYKFENGAYRQIQPHEIKTGDYVALALNVKVNVPTDRTHTPGLYVNPAAIELVGYGTEIKNTADPMALFGGTQYQLPPGASSQPVMSSGGVGMPGVGGGMPGQMPMGQAPMQPGMMPGQMAPQQPPMQPGMMPGQMPGMMPQTAPQQPMGQPQQTPGMMPQQQYQQPMQAPQQQIQPAHDFVQNAGQQPMPGMVPQQPGMMPQQQYQQPQQMPGQMPMMPGQIPGR